MNFLSLKRFFKAALLSYINLFDDSNSIANFSARRNPEDV